MNDLMIFNNNEFGQVRTLEIKGKIYFIGKDVAKALGYKDTTNAIKPQNNKEVQPLYYESKFKDLFINTDRSNIVKACKGKIKYSGKINGEPARWMYYEDYLKLDDKEGII